MSYHDPTWVAVDSSTWDDCKLVVAPRFESDPDRTTEFWVSQLLKHIMKKTDVKIKPPKICMNTERLVKNYQNTDGKYTIEFGYDGDLQEVHDKAKRFILSGGCEGSIERLVFTFASHNLGCLFVCSVRVSGLRTLTAKITTLNT